jgi:DNA-binding transcriptional regulator GbsR (MarR family)
MNFVNGLSVIDLAGLAGLIIALWTVFKGLRTQPHEISQINADTVGKYQEAANRAVEQLLSLEGLLKSTQSELESAKRLIKEQGDMIAKLKSENDDLRDWADRMVHQLMAHEIEPVKLRREITKPPEVKTGGDIEGYDE